MNQEQESQNGETQSANSKKRRRGRPRKNQPSANIDPEMLHRAILDVKKMAGEYARGDLQYDVRYIEFHRPRLLNNAGIFNSNGNDGHIRYDAHSIETMVEKDRKVIHRYITSRETIAFLEKAVEEIPELKVREVACNTLLKGIRVADFAAQYGVSERTVRWRKHRALEYLAKQYLMTLTAEPDIF